MTYEPKISNSGLEYFIYTLPVIKSQNDDRIYQHIKLTNQLEILLISDPKTEKSAASLDVFVGSQNDPIEFPGLAHFCEHLLFMGTEKYPKENDYSEYLSNNAGYSNAYTSYDHTNYYFEVGPDHFEGALDRFAQFFISSLFSPECTEREIKAVDSENKKNLQNDMWRTIQIQKSHSKKDHPFSRFSTGNLETLLEIPKSKGLDTRDELIKFYKKYYSSNIMKLVIAGKESIEELIDWSVNKFTPIKDLDIKVPNYLGSPFSEEHFKTKTYVVSVNDHHCLELQFEIPTENGTYDSKACCILSNLIGHEGPGSILSLLKSKGWATELSVGCSNSYSEFGTFSIFIDLTTKGLDEVDEINLIVFQYIKLLKEGGINEDLVNEMKILNEVGFKFQEKFSISDYVSLLSGHMHYPFKPNQLLIKLFLLENYQANLVLDTLNCFNLNTLRIFLSSKKFEDRKDLIKEPWYNTDYFTESIDENLLKRIEKVEINFDLKLPELNPFVPSDFDLISTNLTMEKVPVLLHKDNKGILWYCQGDYQTPKATSIQLFKNPYCYSSPRSFIKLELLVSILLENLNEFGYDAKSAGLGYHLESQNNGICITLSGYSHKLEVLLDQIIFSINNFKIDLKVFENCKEKMIRELNNFNMDQPSQHANYYSGIALCEKVWSNEDKLIELPSITENELMNFKNEFFSRGHLTTLIVGNMSQKNTLNLHNNVLNQFNLTSLNQTELKLRRNISLPSPKCSFYHQISVYNPDTLDSSIEFYLDLFSYSNFELRAYTELINHLMSEPLFNQLRTVEQLGYMVYSTTKYLESRGGIKIVLQSEKSPKFLEDRIEQFLISFKKQIEEMNELAFKAKIDSLISILIKKDDNLYSLADRHWSSIDSGFLDFDDDQIIVSFLKNCTKSKVIDLLDQFYLKDSPNRKKFSVHLKSKKIDFEQDNQLLNCGDKIEDLYSWIQQQNLSPAPYPLTIHEIFKD